MNDEDLLPCRCGMIPERSYTEKLVWSITCLHYAGCGARVEGDDPTYDQDDLVRAWNALQRR